MIICKKRVIGICLLINLLAVSGYGQTNQTSIGLVLKPTITNDYLSDDDYDDFKNPMFVLNGGFNIQHGIDSSFRIGSGVYFLQTGTSFYAIPLGIYDDFSEGNYREVNRYLSIPFNVTYKRKGFIIGAGPQFYKYFGKRIIRNDKVIEDDINVHSFNIGLGAQLFVGYEVDLWEHWKLSLKGYTNPVGLHTGLNGDFPFLEPFSLNTGLSFGIHYKLNQDE